METISELPFNRLTNQKVDKLLAENLNRVYCAKKHMLSYFSTFAGQVRYADVQDIVNETIADVKKQVSRMDKVFEILEVRRTNTYGDGMVAAMDELLDNISDPYEDIMLRDFRILSYLQIIEAIEVASFKIIKVLFLKIDNEQVLKLIIENLRESKADRQMLQMMTERCVGV